MQASAAARFPSAARFPPAAGSWDSLRALCQAAPPMPVPVAPGPVPVAPGLCQVCTGPARHGCARCYQCELHAQSAPGLLADAKSL